MTQEATAGGRAARTRAAILEAAEEIFAERGFAATRLEDVAARVGIRRASIVYYFRDKRELYEAVLQGVFSGLHKRIESALSSPDPLPYRVEAGVSAWVDYVGTRPSFARLLLREVADSAPGRDSAVRMYTQPYFDLIRKQIVERPDRAAEVLTPVDPVHMASTIAGATVFFAAAMPALVPELGIDPTNPEQLAGHREQVLRIVRRLLGTAPQTAGGEGSGTRRAKRSPSPRGERRSPRR